MRQPVDQDRASAGRQGDFGRRTEIPRRETAPADRASSPGKRARRSRCGCFARRGADASGARSSNAWVVTCAAACGIGNNRQRHAIAAVKAAGRRLQIKRRDLRTGLVEIEGPRGVERVGQALPGEHGPPAATAKMQRSFRPGRKSTDARRAVASGRATMSSKAGSLRISETKRPGSWHRPRPAMPSPVRALVARIGRPSRTARASASMASRSTPTNGARSVLLTTSKSQRSTPGPRLRGMSSPPATSITKIHQSTRSSEKVEARLSPPDSKMMSSTPGNLRSSSSPAAMLSVGSSRMTVCGQAPASTRGDALPDRSGRSGAAARRLPW